MGLLGFDRGLLGAHDFLLRHDAVGLALDHGGDVGRELDLGEVDLALDAGSRSRGGGNRLEVGLGPRGAAGIAGAEAVLHGGDDRVDNDAHGFHRVIVAGNINAAALREREDSAKLNANLRGELESKGLVFNQPDVTPFREKLRSAGFYAEWKGKYGDQAWALLEKSVGKLS